MAFFCRPEEGNSSSIKFGTLDVFAIQNEDANLMAGFRTRDDLGLEITIDGDITVGSWKLQEQRFFVIEPAFHYVYIPQKDFVGATSELNESVDAGGAKYTCSRNYCYWDTKCENLKPKDDGYIGFDISDIHGLNKNLRLPFKNLFIQGSVMSLTDD